MTDISKLNRTARRVVETCGIPVDEVHDLGFGIVVAPESYRSAITAAFTGQKQYAKWLGRGYGARFHPVNAVGDGLWVLGPSAALATRSPSTLTWARVHDDGSVPASHSTPIAGLVSATCVAVARKTGRTNSAGELENDGRVAFSTGSTVSVAVAIRSIFGTPAGDSYLVGVDMYGAMYDGASVGWGGVDGVTPDPVRITWAAAKSAVAKTPSPSGVMMLITGPAILTWGEIGCGRAFCFATAVDVADVMQTVADAIPDSNERARAQLGVDRTRARGLDVMGWVSYQPVAHPYRAYGPTALHWRECAASTDVRDGVDWGKVNAAIGANVGTMVFGGVSGTDARDDPALLGVVDSALGVDVSVFGDGMVDATNCSPQFRIQLSRDGVVEWVGALRAGGVTVRLVDVPALPDEWSELREQIAAATEQPVPQLGSLWSQTEGDKGACAALCIAAAIQPNSASKIAALRAISDPLYMERGDGI